MYMRPTKQQKNKKVKISISIDPTINDKMENDMSNKSKLIESLLRKYYDNIQNLQNNMHRE